MVTGSNMFIPQDIQGVRWASLTLQWKSCLPINIVMIGTSEVVALLQGCSMYVYHIHS